MDSNKGCIPWNKGKKGQVPWNKGKKGLFSQEKRAYSQRLYSKSLKGKEASKERRLRHKTLVFEHYSAGTPKCACCGVTDLEFLTIDHLNGDGAEHRKKWGGRGGDKLYDELIREGYPYGYQVLCMNCNWSKGRFGYCPHNKRREGRGA